MHWIILLFTLLLVIWLAWFVVAMSLSAVMAMLVVMVGAAGFTMTLLVMSWLSAGLGNVCREFKGAIIKSLQWLRWRHLLR